MARNKPTNSSPGGQERFATTHWSVVLAAGRSSSPRHEPALSTLCQTYWFPLYAYLRRHGHDAHEAADYTQAFFAQMLDKDYLKKVKPKGGKFRSFLLTALKHFVANERARAAARKRGGADGIGADYGPARRRTGGQRQTGAFRPSESVLSRRTKRYSLPRGGSQTGYD